LVYTAFFKVLGSVVGFAFVFLEYCVGDLECYPSVGLFEKIGILPNLGALVSEGDPFLYWLFLDGALLCTFDFSFLIMGIGKLLLFVIVRIVCHSVYFYFSGERGKDVIRLIR
jgi:hypothetical protein